MTGQLQDPAWQQQEADDDDGNDGYTVRCEDCGTFGWVATVEEISGWTCWECEGEAEA